MIYLLLAITSSALISIIMRFSEKQIKNQMAMFMANYFICMTLSYVFMEPKTFDFNSTTFLMGFISGILYLVSFVYLKMNMRHNGIVMSSTFSKLGILIPTLMAIVVFHEQPKITQLLGIGLSILAIIMINFEKEEGQSYKKMWLIILLLMSGMTDSMANIFDKLGVSSQKDMYLLFTFLFAFLLASLLTFKDKNKISKQDLLYGMLIGIPNYFSSRFLLLALGSMNAVLVYPMFSVSTIIVISLAGILFFKEKISTKKKYAIGIILLAVCLMNV